MPTLSELKNYMVDCLGYSEEEITKEDFNDLTESQKVDCKRYNAQEQRIKEQMIKTQWTQPTKEELEAKREAMYEYIKIISNPELKELYEIN